VAIRKKTLAATGIALSVAVFVLGLWFFEHPHRRFDSAVWKSPSTQATVRLQMADDLTHHHKLIGLTRMEVVTLLGEPPKTEYFKGFDLVYLLGPERGFISIDSEWLVIRLGEDGRVNSASIARD
jgi:hypothetical protein